MAGARMVCGFGAACLVAVLSGSCLDLGSPGDGDHGTGGSSGQPDSGMDGSGPWPCTTARADCDGNLKNGCEVDLQTHAFNCGTCGKACPSAPNADPACVDGECAIDCDAFTANCDGNDENGCELPVITDPNNCGDCGHACGNANATSATCADGACAIACSAGYGNCDANDANGCEQSLAAPAHCGSCGNACKDGPCADGVCTPSLFAELSDPSAFCMMSGQAYIAKNVEECDSDGNCSTDTDLVKVSSPGAVPSVVDPDPGDVVQLVCVEPDTLYWIGNGQLSKRTADTTSIVTKISATAFALDGVHAVYTTGSNALRSTPLQGGTEIQLIPSGVQQAGVAALGGTSFAWVGSPGALTSIPTTGGAATSVSTSAARGFRIAATNGFVYWTTDNGNSVHRALASGGTAEDIAIGQKRPREIAVDETHVYWWNRDAGTLVRKPIAGGAEQTLMKLPQTDVLIALDQTYVYLLQRATQKLYRLTK